MTRKPKNTQDAGDALQGAQAPVQAEVTGAAPADDGADTLAGGTTSPADPSPPGPTVLVTGPKRGRWRAGMHFTPAPTALVLADLAPGVLEALQADPALTVQIVDAPY